MDERSLFCYFFRNTCINLESIPKVLLVFSYGSLQMILNILCWERKKNRLMGGFPSPWDGTPRLVATWVTSDKGMETSSLLRKISKPFCSWCLSVNCPIIITCPWRNPLTILPAVSQAEQPDPMSRLALFVLRGDLGDLQRFLPTKIILWFSLQLIMVNYTCPEFQTSN